jgi:hypothetical protein
VVPRSWLDKFLAVVLLLLVALTVVFVYVGMHAE